MCPFYEEIDAILGTHAAPTPAMLLESAADGTVVVPSANDFYCQAVPRHLYWGYIDAESDEVNSSATPTTTPTNTSVPTPTSTTTTTTY